LKKGSKKPLQSQGPREKRGPAAVNVLFFSGFCLSYEKPSPTIST